MTFTKTYREERLINRRSRARTARILGRIIGFGLTACLLVALKTDPKLRAMVEDLALAAVGGTVQEVQEPDDWQADAIAELEHELGNQEARRQDRLGITGEAQQALPVVVQMPVSRVKVNRGGS